MTSAFGIDHGDISKATDREKKAVAGGVAAAGATGLVATKTYMPEHSHYSKETRAHLKSLPAGVHEVDTEMLMHRPRKLGARKQQRPYVAAMAQERPTPYSPVPITRYKDGVIQRDNAHSVMANAMKGRKTLVKIEDAPGYRPSRRTGEELIRRGQMRYQQHRLKQNTNLSDKKIDSIRAKYKDSSRKANTTKRPHGVVEEGFKASTKPFGAARALGLVRKNRHDELSGAAAAAGLGAFASTPVRRSGAKVKIKDGRMSANDAKKVLSPGYRPGNKKAIQTMARNMGHLENSPTKVIRYKDGHVIPFDGNHRGTARVARGDSSIPVKEIKGGERPAVSVARNAFHVGQQKIHQARMDRGAFTPGSNIGAHAGHGKLYGKIANGSALRSGRHLSVDASRLAQGPTTKVLRTKQGLALGAGTALMGLSYSQHKKAKTNG